MSSSDIIWLGIDEMPQYVQKLAIKIHTNGMYANHFSSNVYVINTKNELKPFGNTIKPYTDVVSVHTKTMDSMIKYNRRLPMKWMMNKNMKLAKMLRKFSTAAA